MPMLLLQRPAADVRREMMPTRKVAADASKAKPMSLKDWLPMLR
jgi:hypothetical protein